MGYQVSDLILYDIRTVELASDWLIANFSTVMNDNTGVPLLKTKKVKHIITQRRVRSILKDRDVYHAIENTANQNN